MRLARRFLALALTALLASPGQVLPLQAHVLEPACTKVADQAIRFEFETQASVHVTILETYDVNVAAPIDVANQCDQCFAVSSDILVPLFIILLDHTAEQVEEREAGRLTAIQMLPSNTRPTSPESRRSPAPLGSAQAQDRNSTPAMPLRGSNEDRRSALDIWPASLEL